MQAGGDACDGTSSALFTTGIQKTAGVWAKCRIAQYRPYGQKNSAWHAEGPYVPNTCPKYMLYDMHSNLRWKLCFSDTGSAKKSMRTYI